MDDCGSIMSVHNVKVIHLFSIEENSEAASEFFDHCVVIVPQIIFLL